MIGFGGPPENGEYPFYEYKPTQRASALEVPYHLYAHFVRDDSAETPVQKLPYQHTAIGEKAPDARETGHTNQRGLTEKLTDTQRQQCNVEAVWTNIEVDTGAIKFT